MLWSTNGKPKAGPLFHMMKSSRAKFKYLVRQCKLKTSRKESDTLAQSLLQSYSRDFWKEIRKLTNRDKCTVLPDTVGGNSKEADICHMWKEHFFKLLNSSQLVDKCDTVYDVSNTCDIFTHIEMLTAISHLKTGKAVGSDCLSAESFTDADTSICVFYVCCSTPSYTILTYPVNLWTLLLYLLLRRKSDLGSKNNFRPIALTTIMSKLF